MPQGRGEPPLISAALPLHCLPCGFPSACGLVMPAKSPAPPLHASPAPAPRFNRASLPDGLPARGPSADVCRRPGAGAWLSRAPAQSSLSPRAEPARPECPVCLLLQYLSRLRLTRFVLPILRHGPQRPKRQSDEDHNHREQRTHALPHACYLHTRPDFASLAFLHTSTASSVSYRHSPARSLLSWDVASRPPTGCLPAMGRPHHVPRRQPRRPWMGPRTGEKLWPWWWFGAARKCAWSEPRSSQAQGAARARRGSSLL